MSSYNNFGIVCSQKFLEEFEWQDKKFYSYLITFNEYQGFFRIIRQSNYEQALIGAKMIFNYSSEQDKISKYRIIGYESVSNTKASVR